MVLLELVRAGKEELPPRIMIYGQEGAWKSSTCAQAPKPIFIQTEDGLSQIDCAKFPLAKSLDEVLTALTELKTVAHPYQTVVIDSLDWLERLVWDAVCREYHVNSIEKADGGWAKGYKHALVHWRKVIALLNDLRLQKGMIVLLTAHAAVDRFEDPLAPTYDRYVPRLHKLACGLWTEWCDAVLFATRKFRVKTEDAGFGRERGVAIQIGAGGGERVLRCIGGPSCVAKNRYHLPEEIPLSWPALWAGLIASTQTPPPAQTPPAAQ